ncbi:MAG: hypothetical protein LBK13_07365 [Spirochaetales bacterium]|nr:hypothetical protein [Spirochaetales bacterium]
MKSRRGEPSKEESTAKSKEKSKAGSGAGLGAQQRWKSAFLTLPDAAFFDILRNYLGEFRTPYNKHDLLENLYRFLLEEETQERIISLVDEEDARLLSAISVLDSPAPDDLYRLFEGEIGYLDLHYRLLNLQDRLLIYTDKNTDKSQGAGALVFTPFLEKKIEERVVDPGLLLSCAAVHGIKIPPPWPGDVLLLAFFSCILEDGDILKTDGALKKKAETILREKIPPLFEGGGSRVMLLAGALKTLKLLREEERLEIDLEAWEEFASFAPRFRLCLLAAAAFCDDFFEVWKEAQWLASFLAYLEAGTAYTAGSLIRLGRLVSSETRFSRRNVSWLERLAAFDILIPHGENASTGTAFLVHPLFPQGRSAPEKAALKPASLEAATQEQAAGKGPPLIIQPNFDINICSHLSLREGLVPAAAAHLVRYDVFSRYELSKVSFARALALGFNGKTVERRLASLCGGKLPQNVVFSLNAWENEYTSIAFLEGVIITAKEDRRHLLEHHREFQKMVRLSPAPGVYVIAREELASCIRILRGAGVEILPQLRGARDIPPSGSAQGRRTKQADSSGNSSPLVPPAVPGLSTGGIVFPRTFQPPALRFPLLGKTAATGRGKIRHSPPRSVERELLDTLTRAKLPEDIAGEIRERIRRRLVIFPKQIQPELVRGERTEAKGLDYMGKTLIIEQALASRGDYLELLVRKSNGSPSRVLVRPAVLRRSGTDLILEGESLPGGGTVSIPVKKISLVRRLRGALSG